MITLFLFFKSLHVVVRRVHTIALAIAACLIFSPTMVAQTSDVQPLEAQQQGGDQYPDEAQAPTQGKLGVSMGPVNFRLYGTLLLNLSASDSTLLGGDVPLWAAGTGNATFPDLSVGRTHDLFITARQTVVGFNISPSTTPASGWVPSAKVEFDFYGSRPADNFLYQSRVFGQPRLRLAYFQLTKGTWKFEAGQDKAIIAPLDPISFSHVSIPLGATAGNLWGWFPQVRVEKTQAIGEKTSVLFQAGALRPEFGDPRLNDAVPTTSVSLDSPTAGTRSSMPFFEARVAISHPMNGSAATIGVGGHYGREVAGVTRHPGSWATALDWRVPLLPRLILRGEAYAGSNLIPFQGGIDQGVAVVVATATTPYIINPIGDAGGWGELTLRATKDDKNHFYVGWGDDNPVRHNLLPGTTRSRNSFYWASYFRKLTPDVTMALEWSYWGFRTTAGRPYSKANVFNLSFAYAF
jgi:hypothetical protein